MLASAGLALLKFLVGLYTGSLGLLAEAVHSLLDLVSTLITLVVLRVAAVPPRNPGQAVRIPPRPGAETGTRDQ